MKKYYKNFAPIIILIGLLVLIVGCTKMNKNTEVKQDLGSYDYVQRVYNENMHIEKYKLPKKLDNGEQTLFDDGLIKMVLNLKNSRVKKITIQTTNPSSTEYMQTFEGFEFGFDAVSTWIQNYHESTSTHGPSKGVVKGIEASYNTTKDNVLTVSLVRVSGSPKE